MGFEPFLKLLIVEDRFDFWRRGFANLAHFGPSRFGGKAPVLHYSSHLRVFLVQNGFDLGLLFFTEVQEFGHSRAVSWGGRRPIGLGSRFLVCFIVGLFLGRRHASQQQSRGKAQNCH